MEKINIKDRLRDFLVKNNIDNILYKNKNVKSQVNLASLSKIIESNSKYLNQLNAIEFNKENDNNGHVDFIHLCSCLFSKVYSIFPGNKLNTFKYVGKIGPTTITSTSIVAGYMCLIMIGILQNSEIKKKQLNKPKIQIEDYSFNMMINRFLVRNLSQIIYKEDQECDPFFKHKIIVLPKKFHSWQKIEIRGSMTINQIIKIFKDKFGVDIIMIEADRAVQIYSKTSKSALPPMSNQNKRTSKTNDKLNEKIEDIYEVKKKTKNIVKILFLTITGRKDGVHTIFPMFKYIY